MMREQACIVTRYRFRVAGDSGMRERPAGEQRGVHMAEIAAAGAAIELRGVSKRYGIAKDRSVKAADSIDLSIPAGAFVAVAGASGSGKSTLRAGGWIGLGRTGGSARCCDRRTAPVPACPRHGRCHPAAAHITTPCRCRRYGSGGPGLRGRRVNSSAGLAGVPGQLPPRHRQRGPVLGPGRIRTTFCGRPVACIQEEQPRTS